MPKRVHPAVELRIAQLAIQKRDWTAGRLAEAVNDEFPPSQPDGPAAVSERWIRARLPALRGTSETWSLRPQETHGAFLLSVLAHLHQQGEAVPRLTKDEADWLRTVHAAVPTLAPDEALDIARLYVAAEALESAQWLHHLLDLELAQGHRPRRLLEGRDGVNFAFGGYHADSAGG